MSRWLTLLALVVWCACPVPARAQQLGVVQSPILTVESERLFSDSRFGLRVAREIQEQGARLAAENRRIEAELTEEERTLTEKRAQMQPDAFRLLADAFDEKVQTIRREQDAKARALTQRNEADRVRFLRAAVPVLEDLMREAGAAVVLERASVFLSANSTDVTDAAIARINAAIGDGEDLD
ncbi:MAG: OmpH family outer membrane protein [Rhodobacteraceae bacterium]|nr:OmpH family outer membrane protein [Paracoccaceae bacterium]